jgi:hypothetical protein
VIVNIIRQTFPLINKEWVYVDPTCGDWFVDFTKEEGLYREYGILDSNQHFFYNMTLGSYQMFSQYGEIDHWYAEQYGINY